MVITASSALDVQRAVRTHPRLLPRGAGTKPGLSSPPEGVAALDLSGLAGVLEYEPAEFTITAWAGTRLADLGALLAQHGQYLPFDPLLVERGATLGGALAAGLSGPGRWRYGGLRDFVLGVRLVDGTGDLVRGGGKVVKNAAGFDLPKLMVGSLGQLGVLVELTFKVFPAPEAALTVRHLAPSLSAALEALLRLCAAPLDLDALDLLPQEPPAAGAELWVRLAGPPGVLPTRAARVSEIVGGETVLEGDDRAHWRAARELSWVPAGWSLLKVPLTPRRTPALEAALAPGALGAPALRRYTAAGNVAWLATPAPPAALDALLAAQGLAGVVVFSSAAPGPRLIGAQPGLAFYRRVKSAIDPEGRFV